MKPITDEEKMYWERRHHEAWLALTLPQHRGAAINRETLRRLGGRANNG